jgi:hypothetical protein
MGRSQSVNVSRLRRAALAVLVLGLLAGLTIYFTANTGNAPDGVRYQIVNGQTFTVDNSREMQELARLGGKSAVMAYQFSQWFDSLWHGQRLAFTVCILCVALAFACWHIASLMAEESTEL